MTAPLVRLGDVAPFLHLGDQFECDGKVCTYTTRRRWDADAMVRLISPRLVPVPVGETIPAGTPWADYTRGIWSGFEPLSIEWTVREGDDTCYRLTRTRLATRADVREGMRVKCLTGAMYSGIVTTVAEGKVWLESGVNFPVTGARHEAVEILAEPEPREFGCPDPGSKVEQLPREVKASELRVGDRYRIHSTDSLQFLVLSVGPGWWESSDGKNRMRNSAVDAPRWLISRDNPIPSQPAPATEPATCSKCGLPETPERHVGYHHDWLCDECAAGERKMATEPAKAGEADLREQWRFLCERTPWDVVAAIHEQRGDSVLFCAPARVKRAAQLCFDQAMRKRSFHCSRHIIVTVTGGTVELYSEALNAAAFATKRDELCHPTKPADQHDTGERCVKCGEPFWAGRLPSPAFDDDICADCGPFLPHAPLPERIAAVRQPDPEPEPNPHGANRENFMHHLRDDVDVWGV